MKIGERAVMLGWIIFIVVNLVDWAFFKLFSVDMLPYISNVAEVFVIAIWSIVVAVFYYTVEKRIEKKE